MKKSPDLEVISNETKESRGRERRRLPRLNLSGEQFRLAQNGKVFSVTDLSTEGMALRILDREDLRLFPVAADIQGTLNLKGSKYPVKAVVRHLGSDLVGCEFAGLDSTVAAALTQFLDPAVLGHELKPIPASDGALWYHGPSGTDLLLWRGVDGQYKRLTLYVLGSFVQWENDAGLSTGRAEVSEHDKSEIRGVVRFETMLLDRDSLPDSGKLSVAKTLILSSNLPQDLKKWCVRQLGSAGHS
jgi:hypothetical protein